jgi:anti-anti-sigma regulatory factor
MFGTHTENVGEMAIIECEGRLVRSEAAFQLRDAVTLQADANIIVLDLTEVHALEGGGLGMLVYLQRWAHDHNIQLKLFNPSLSARHRLEQASSMYEFEIANLFEMTTLLTRAEQQEALASMTMTTQPQHSVA